MIPTEEMAQLRYTHLYNLTGGKFFPQKGDQIRFIVHEGGKGGGRGVGIAVYPGIDHPTPGGNVTEWGSAGGSGNDDKHFIDGISEEQIDLVAGLMAVMIGCTARRTNADEQTIMGDVVERSYFFTLG